jgi:hypothetical protein
LSRTIGNCNGVSSKGSCEWRRNSPASKRAHSLLPWPCFSTACKNFQLPFAETLILAHLMVVLLHVALMFSTGQSADYK